MKMKRIIGLIIYFFLLCPTIHAQEVIRTAEISDEKGTMIEKVKSRIQYTSNQISFEHIFMGRRYKNPETYKPIWIDSEQLITEDEISQMLVESLVKKVKKKVILTGEDRVKALEKEPAENQVIVRYYDNQTMIPFNRNPFLGTLSFDLNEEKVAWTDTLPSFRFKGFFVNTYSNVKDMKDETVQVNFTSRFVVGHINKEDYKSVRLPNGGIQYQTYMTNCLAKGTFVVDTSRKMIMAGQYTLKAAQVDMIEQIPGKYVEIPHELNFNIKFSNELK